MLTITFVVKWLPQADRIIVLGPNGTLRQIGTYEELVSSTGYIQDLVLKMSGKALEPEISHHLTSPFGFAFGTSLVLGTLAYLPLFKLLFVLFFQNPRLHFQSQASPIGPRPNSTTPSLSS